MLYKSMFLQQYQHDITRIQLEMMPFTLFQDANFETQVDPFLLKFLSFSNRSAFSKSHLFVTSSIGAISSKIENDRLSSDL